ncbi:MAG: hypothetical protein GY925_13210, partial [Actinomycetia bacterium]|nr:hypothetical protein [Actinomycetes bacterium]
MADVYQDVFDARFTMTRRQRQSLVAVLGGAVLALAAFLALRQPIRAISPSDDPVANSVVRGDDDDLSVLDGVTQSAKPDAVVLGLSPDAGIAQIQPVRAPAERPPTKPSTTAQAPPSTSTTTSTVVSPSLTTSTTTSSSVPTIPPT